LLQFGFFGKPRGRGQGREKERKGKERERKREREVNFLIFYSCRILLQWNLAWIKPQQLTPTTLSLISLSPPLLFFVTLPLSAPPPPIFLNSNPPGLREVSDLYKSLILVTTKSDLKKAFEKYLPLPLYSLFFSPPSPSLLHVSAAYMFSLR
jgi:hypothetical protein